jgi:microsomal dipeptidase-like Zn-dependent dipeptidase
VTRRRTTAALAAGATAAAGLALAAPVLDRLIGRVERRLSPLTAPPPHPSERALALHATLRAVDLHADSLLFGRDLLVRGDRGHLDVPRMIEGGVALQVFSAAVKSPRHLNIERNDDRSDDVTSLALAGRWPPRTWRSLPERALFLAGRAHRLAARSGGAFRLIGSREDLAAYLADRARDRRLTAGLLAIEGAHALGPDLSTLDALVEAGFRMISPAHFFDTAYGGSAHGLEKGGLTDLGRELILEMEGRGLLVDVAHASSATIDDVVTMASRPVVASHTGVRATADNGRNLTDDQLRGIAATGGIVGIGFWDTATGGRDAAAIARAIVHAVSVVGADHVGLGSDWDGAVPVPFDAAGLPALTDALLAAGLDNGTIRAVMGENALRLFAEVLPSAVPGPAL